MNRTSTVVLVALLGSLLIGCRDSGTGPDTITPPPTSGGTVSFSGRILPIFVASGCTGCHGGTSGLTVTSVGSLLTGGSHGPAILAGNATNSILYQKLLATPPFGARMPQGGPYLPDSTVAVIGTWINEGARNN
jgi:hypothetical protein